MNIFALSSDPVKAAMYQCDKHVIKMPTETCQMLSTAHRILQPEYAERHGVYKVTHPNHPCNVWIRQSRANYRWAYKLAVALIAEYDFRYGKPGKYERLRELLAGPLARYPMGRETGYVLTPFALGFKSYPELISCNHVLSYRRFYVADKHRFARWKHGRPEPGWWRPMLLAYRRQELADWKPGFPTGSKSAKNKRVFGQLHPL